MIFYLVHCALDVSEKCSVRFIFPFKSPKFDFYFNFSLSDHP